jgi:urease accessory protein
MKKIRSLTIATLCTLPLLAHAHPGHAEAGMLSGLLHPLTGLDHLLALLAIGILSTQHALQRSTHWPIAWKVPALFIASMTIGAFGATSLGSITVIERIIVPSVIMLGLAIAAAWQFKSQLSKTIAALVMCVFALAHGYAHGNETTHVGVEYLSGMLLATSGLCLCGMGIGLLSKQTRRAGVARWLGLVIACTGALMTTQ